MWTRVVLGHMSGESDADRCQAGWRTVSGSPYQGGHSHCAGRLFNEGSGPYTNPTSRRADGDQIFGPGRASPSQTRI